MFLTNRQASPRSLSLSPSKQRRPAIARARLSLYASARRLRGERLRRDSRLAREGFRSSAAREAWHGAGARAAILWVKSKGNRTNVCVCIYTYTSCRARNDAWTRKASESPRSRGNGTRAPLDDDSGARARGPRSLILPARRGCFRSVREHTCVCVYTYTSL